jgi:hypothetical protein
VPRRSTHALTISKATTAVAEADADSPGLLDAFERLCLEIVQIEAIAHVADAAIDAYGIPLPETRREFERVHALVSQTAEKAAAAVELAEELKASVECSLMTRRRGSAKASSE